MNDDNYVSEIAEQTGDIGLKLAAIRTIEAEKRTYLAELRTGIGILTIPLSLLTILIATSNYYSINDVLVFIFGLIIGILLLSIVGGYLVIRALQRLRTADMLKRETCIDTASLVREIGKKS